jgi:CTP synthase (UTP-ammonia lyase)
VGHMDPTIRIGVIGDYDGRPSHIATGEAIRHCAYHLDLKQEIQWLPTVSLEAGYEQYLHGFDAFWCAPGSPYKSAQGAMNAIRFARENNYPFIGTCGGFQYVVLEFARDVLDLPEIKQSDFDPYTPNLFIAALGCSLIGETRTIFLTEGTKVAQIYSATYSEERYNCDSGLNDRFRNQIVNCGFVVAGTDEAGDTRILELPRNNFFIATLFQPQLSSTPENPHKLILAYLKEAAEFRQRQYQSIGVFSA